MIPDCSLEFRLKVNINFNIYLLTTRSNKKTMYSNCLLVTESNDFGLSLLGTFLSLFVDSSNIGLLPFRGNSRGRQR